MGMHDLYKFMSSENAMRIGVANMSEQQQRALLEWGMYMYGLGQHVVSAIDAVKYDGRLVILDDGSRWEVASHDATTADTWSPGDKVLVIDDAMYKLDESERVDVSEET